MYYLLVVSAIVFLVLYERRIENNFIKKIESRFTRKIEYRDYCGVLSYSYNNNKFYCKLSAIIEESSITGDRWLFLIKSTEEKYFETESDTESGALASFYSHVDWLLDSKPTYLDDDDLLFEFAKEHNISLEEAKHIRYVDLHSRDLKREAERKANNRVRYDLHF